MNLVSLDKVGKSYGERQLFEDIDLRINAGDRIGLIGINGSGKSTLLRIVAGLEKPDFGHVTVWGGVDSSYLPQEPQIQGEQTVLSYLYAGESTQLQLQRQFSEVGEALAVDPDNPRLQEEFNHLTHKMESSGNWAAEARAKAILSKIGIKDTTVSLDKLSGGQRKRVALARVLIDPADLLILDEPTNHIDAWTVSWLEEFLLELPGALLMVTHDRYFLSRVVNQICELDRRGLAIYPGNYRKYLEQSSQRQERLSKAEKKRQKLLKRELEWVRRSPMARGTKQKARKQRIEEMQEIRYDRQVDTIAMALASRRLGKKVIFARNLSKSFDDLTLFQEQDFELVPGDRIGIVGPNGAGKSTLLDIIAGISKADTGSIERGPTVELGYYDQLSQGLDENSRVIDFINDAAPLIRTNDGRRIEAARMLEWFLFTRHQQQTYISSLSGGERRRLYLLWVLVKQPNVLFIDEPTNDLDIPTLQVLEEFLDHFKGVLVVVSHDRFFLDRNVEYLVSLQDGVMSGRIPGPYDHFRQVVKESQVAEGQPKKRTQRRRGPVGGMNSDAGSTTTADKLSWKEARELEKLEKEIDNLEQQKKQIEQEVNEAGGQYEVLQDLAAQLGAVEEVLQSTTERWLELAEIEG